MDHLKLCQEPLDVSAIYQLVCDPSCGAVSLFIGNTRNQFDGKTVVRLEYEAYQPMAIKSLESLAKELREKYGVLNIAIHHR